MELVNELDGIEGEDLCDCRGLGPDLNCIFTGERRKGIKSF